MGPIQGRLWLSHYSYYTQTYVSLEQDPRLDKVSKYWRYLCCGDLKYGPLFRVVHDGVVLGLRVPTQDAHWGPCNLLSI